MTAPPATAPVFITGASSGIGAALARHYATRGAPLGLVGRRTEALEALCKSLPRPETHRIYPLDITDRAALFAAARHFIDEVGTPAIVIANAGISRGTLTSEAVDLAAFDETFATNVLGLVSTFAAFLPALTALPAARLVGISSVAGVRGLPGAGAYSASKAAVTRYCESLRVELASSSVRVVTIAPGYIDTPMTQGNPYPMPFLMPVDAFVERAASAIARGQSYAVYPWQMRWVARLLALLPNRLYDLALGRAPRKPRAR